MNIKIFVSNLLDEWFFILTLSGLVVTSLWLKRFPMYNLADFKVLYVLFVFLVMVKGLEKSGFFHNVSLKLSQKRYLPQKLIFFAALLSMFVTNDVALFVVIPLTLSMKIERKELIVVLETITANVASSLTPFGNPQNIFIYYYYNLHPLEFVKTIAPFSGITLIVILLFSFVGKCRAKRSKALEIKKHSTKAYVYLISFLLFALSVLKILPIEVGGVPVLYAILYDRRSLMVDYLLLATFFAFFGFTDNLMHILKFELNGSLEVFFFSALGSQVVSNVPSALLFADFTKDWKALLWGVNVGGCGTLISSIANLITYRLYKMKYGRTKSFLLKFHFYGFVFFGIGVLVYIIHI
ncbi:hypothetical protein BG95_01350 [Thermosipho sp. 1063]|uniref:SLC13 family permease n=1 Tax=unclassified Thermosipho (in: thermotogales) TaxID=2676525 RepID=UPI0009494A5C|nr:MULTISPECIES: SLC13 family permease [unclassified Thermosipho (in: thermotogales)]ANQ54559.1 hypothetical protein Y592_01355 [Thermosipho sp. 1070]APT72994.1 hypothetical protein BG95_01350 [Thermosipho sp. 1063]OOC45701.1 hypothetical protein XO08_01350 [Thermosipho sp. 1074]